ncbi:MAG TPA: aspartate aminotransferase family protein [Bryobacteraceae bacterium]|jgi:adenosylmethionine-8-amino-7-oxononanoate aminotransferase|nr:aspartate aminotransferase family protein [Bryobacteraceae bacterium]
MALSTAELVKSDHEHLIHPLHHPVDHADPVIFVRGCGAVVEDINGNKYIDGLSSLWNVNAGHGRAELAEAAAAQMKELAYFSAYAGSTNVPVIKLAEKLIDLAYDNMQAVFFTSGGAEANESAFKTARFYWKANGKPEKVKFIARHQGYHGVTLQAMSATSMGAYWKMFEPRMPGFVHIPPCYPYRFQGAKPGETIGQAAARDLEEAILREGPDTVAGFIGEPIHGAGGVIYPTDDYWPLVREICTKHNVLMIADEVITGFGRTGKWFALGHWNVQPDIMSFAKGVTSGQLPLGGIMVSKAIKHAMDTVEPANRWMHAYTYSGHPTCCAVGLKNVEIIEREGLCENAAKMGARLYAGLQSAFGDHPNAGDIRGGKGLLTAVEFVEDRATKKNFAADQKIAPRYQAELMKRGVITRTLRSGGPHPATGDMVFFAPPLVITESEVDRLVSAARDAAKAVFGA